MYGSRSSGRPLPFSPLGSSWNRPAIQLDLSVTGQAGLAYQHRLGRAGLAPQPSHRDVVVGEPTCQIPIQE